MRSVATREDIRDLILDATDRLLSSRGYKKMTMEDLAQFFRETKEEYERRADRAKQLLTTHLGNTQGRGASGGNK